MQLVFFIFMALTVEKNIEKLRDFLSDNYSKFDEKKFNDLSIKEQIHLTRVHSHFVGSFSA